MTASVTKLPAPARAAYEAGAPSPYHAPPPASKPADAEIAERGERLRSYARHLAQNSSIARAVIDSRVSAGIGAGLQYEPLVRDRKGKLLERLNDLIRREIVDGWGRRADTSGEYSRAELERVAWKSRDVDGEVFARRVFRGRTQRRIGYQVQLLESDLVPYGLLYKDRIYYGVERDDWGEPQRYHIVPTRFAQPFYGLLSTDAEPRSIPARDMWHLRRQDRPGQTRGVTLFHAVMFRISDIAEYMESHRLAARASADLFASINRSPDVIDAPDSDQDARDWTFEHLQMIDGLAAGEAVNFHAPQHPNQNAVEFIREELRAIASACRCGFSWIANVWDASYAAQRLGEVNAFRYIEQDRAQFIADFARPCLYEEPLKIALLENRLPRRELRRADPSTLYDVRIDGPQMPVIDQKKDRDAYALDQANGWDSRHGIIRRMGRNPAAVDAEREQDDFQPPAAAQAQPPAPHDEPDDQRDPPRTDHAGDDA